ncbi:lipopolysaccharide biosynthesis protein [Bacteroidota bacterium]
MIEKLKELTKDTAIYGISTIVGRFLGFLLVPFYTNFILPKEFGIFAYIYAYIAFLNILYIYGLDAAFLKYTSLASEEEKKDTFSTPFIFVTFTSVLFSAFIFLTQDTLKAILNIPESYSYLIYFVIFILLFDTLALIPFANLRLERKAGKFAAIKILNILINLILNIVLITYYNLGIKAIFISNVIASGFSLVVLLPDIFKKFKAVIDFGILKKMLKFGLPYLPASIAAMIVQVIDRPILRSLADDTTLGIYQANYKLGIFMMLFVSMFQYAWQPFFLTNAKEKNAKEIFAKVLTLFAIVGSIILVALSLFVEEIAKIEVYQGHTLIGKEYLGGVIIVPIILFGYYFHGFYVNFNAGLYIEEKTKYFPAVTGVGALVNIIVNFALIPVWGITGAALATLASYFVMAVGLFVVSQKVYKIEYEYVKLFKIFLLIIIIASAYYYLLIIGELAVINKIGLLLGFFILLLLLRVIKKSELTSIVQMFNTKSN